MSTPHPSTWVDGEPVGSVSASDRGLWYGDGVYRTLRVAASGPLLWERHYRRLAADCAALALPVPEERLLRPEVEALAAGCGAGVVRITVTRGRSARGYAIAAGSAPTRIVAWFPAPHRPLRWSLEGVEVRLCELRLARQPRLAGIKHLNRLEQVLARAEWSDPQIAEGLLLDAYGHVIEGTMSNLFVVEGGALATPDLSQCGTAGIQRDRVLEWAAAEGVPASVGVLTLDRVLAADELFLVNSIIGLWPVRAIAGMRRWPPGRFPVAARLAVALAATGDGQR
jgi:4-amino-4-deoxychorismate lyase